MPERHFDDPTLPPPGRRSGQGTSSIVPYLLKSLATRPQLPPVQATPARLQPAAPAPAHGADLPP